MLRITSILMMLLPPAHGMDISYFDSATNPKISIVLVDDCAVKVPKNKVKDTCFIIKKISDFCNLDLKLDECKNGTK